MEDGGTYTFFKQDDRPVGGMMSMQSLGLEGVPSHWMAYLTVEDVDAACARCTELGGKILMAPMDVRISAASHYRRPVGRGGRARPVFFFIGRGPEARAFLSRAGPCYNAPTGCNGDGKTVEVLVRDNDVDQALRALKKKMQARRHLREMKMRRSYEKPSERRAREKAEAIRRARKLERKRLEREGY